MGLIQKLKGAVTKEPTFPITQHSKWTDYTHLLESDNYLDQYFGWTFKAIKTVADSIVEYPIGMYIGDKQADGIREEISEGDSQLLKDLYEFNEDQHYKEARKLTLIHKRLTGVAYWLITDAERKEFRYEFYILNPDRVSVHLNKETGLPEYYRYRDSDGQHHNVDKEDLVIFREPNPKNWMKGQSVVQASRLPHNTWELASKYNMNFFGNNAMPEGLLMFENLSERERSRLEQILKEKYRGPEKSGKLGVINKVAEWIRLTESQKDIRYVEGLKEMRTDILSMHGVPKPLVGLTDSTYTNSIEAQRIFQRYTIKPELEVEEDVYNKQLLRKYLNNGKVLRNASKVFFMAPNPVEADSEAIAKEASILYKDGVATRNEARDLVGLDPVDDGDEFTNTNNPLSMIGQDEDEEQEEDNDEVTEEVRALRLEVKRLQRLEVKRLQESIYALPGAEQIEKKKRERIERLINKQLDSNEESIVNVAKEYFSKQEERVLGGLKTAKKQIGLDFEFDVGDEAKLAIAAFGSVFLAIARSSNDVANSLADGDIDLAQAVISQIRDNLRVFAEEINKTTKEDLTKIISTGVQEGWDKGKTREEISKLFRRYTKSKEDALNRAETIARTESTPIFNFVSRRNYAQNESVTGSEWLSAKDESVREAHQQADGQQVPKGVKFSVGGEFLEYPGDKSASPENIINCRCAIIPVML